MSKFAKSAVIGALALMTLGAAAGGASAQPFDGPRGGWHHGPGPWGWHHHPRGPWGWHHRPHGPWGWHHRHWHRY